MSYKQITINDIAKRIGVSKTTVSRYLNGKFEYMSQDTKKRIEEAIAETGYRPNRLANSLKTDKSDLIGVVMSNIMSNQTPQLLGSICSTCTKHGKKIVVVNSEKNPEKEKQLAQDLIDQRVDGLLVISGYNSEFYQELDRNELPVVLADRVPKNVDMDSVAINHRESTYRVVSHLLEQGYERIVVLSRPHKNPYNTPAIRVSAAEKACKEHFGSDEHCVKVVIPAAADNANSPDFDETMAQMERYYKQRLDVPTAIFVAEASIMPSIACCYYRAGMELSRSFTIAGYCSDVIKNFFNPTICTIEQPLERMGELAVERLLKRIEIDKSGNEEPVRESILLSCLINMEQKLN